MSEKISEIRKIFLSLSIEERKTFTKELLMNASYFYDVLDKKPNSSRLVLDSDLSLLEINPFDSQSEH